MSGHSFIVCTVKPWNLAAFVRRTPAIPGSWHLVQTRDELTPELLERIAPRYVFFPHWSWCVPIDMIGRFECIGFHMADVPYGRGGSPLQNLIIRGHTTTTMTALRMIEELDAGPVYLKRPLSLEGRAEEIFERAADLVYDMIGEIITRSTVPVPQHGEPVFFARRAPHESALPQDGSTPAIFNFIRMLDAPTYPKAFIDWGKWRIEFDHARVEQESVEARVLIRKKDQT